MLCASSGTPQGNGAERRIFAAYGRRHTAYGTGIPALLPQV